MLIKTTHKISWSEYIEMLDTHVQSTLGKRNENLIQRVEKLKEILQAVNPQIINDPALLTGEEWIKVYHKRIEFAPASDDELTRLLRCALKISRVADAINTSVLTKTIPLSESGSDCMTYWLGEHLKEEGWNNIIRTYANIHGNDLSAEKENRKMIALVKNPSLSLSSVAGCFGNVVTKLLNQRHDNPSLQTAVVFPDDGEIKNYLRGVLHLFKEQQITLYWIASDTTVTTL